MMINGLFFKRFFMDLSGSNQVIDDEPCYVIYQRKGLKFERREREREKERAMTASSAFDRGRLFQSPPGKE